MHRGKYRDAFSRTNTSINAHDALESPEIVLTGKYSPTQKKNRLERHKTPIKIIHIFSKIPLQTFSNGV